MHADFVAGGRSARAGDGVGVFCAEFFRGEGEGEGEEGEEEEGEGEGEGEGGEAHCGGGGCLVWGVVRVEGWGLQVR